MATTTPEKLRAMELVKEEATAAARSAVFNTAELFESILLWLPPNDLLRAQQVCKFVKANIEASGNIQRALFLKPLNDDLTYWKADVEPGTHKLVIGNWISVKDHEKRFTPTINPMMRRFILTEWLDKVAILHVGFVMPVFDPTAYVYASDIDGGDDEVEDIGPRNTEELSRLHRKYASWRSMLFMQPPCTKLTFPCEYHLETGESEEEWFEAANPNGVTLQDVLDACRRHWNFCPNCPLDYKVPLWDCLGHTTNEVTLLDKDIGNTWELLAKLKQACRPQDIETKDHS